MTGQRSLWFETGSGLRFKLPGVTCAVRRGGRAPRPWLWTVHKRGPVTSSAGLSSRMDGARPK